MGVFLWWYWWLGVIFNWGYCPTFNVWICVEEWCVQDHGHSEGLYNQNMTLQYFFWTADPLATKLGLMAHHHKLDCLVKRLDCSLVVKVKWRVQSSSECSSGRYLLSCWTFCNQTWYSDASSWASVMQNWFAVFKFNVIMRSRIIRWLFLPYLLISLQRNLIGWHHHMLEYFA